ncbi:ion transport peptide-like isoform X1 [Nylanderia fulva]|uniref:ion transport peptide-like isoform X1 n=1 Tax=Nylanderia fulva TaxID=613905 RepID=UPI0010FAE180|nr:ion transport peptide-like isoform X1 [Nylanderia fulva]
MISNKMMHRQQNAQSSSSNNEFAMYPSAAYHSSCSTLVSSTSTPSSSSRSSSTTCPFLLSVLTWSLTFLLISSCIGLGADAATLNGHPLGKRSFFDIQCKGVYDKSIFARLDRICEDCYNLFREPQLHMLCKKECFTTDYFKGCLDVLLLTDEVGKIQMWIKQLHGADPGV